MITKSQKTSTPKYIKHLNISTDMVFSWKETIIKADKKLIEQSKVLAKSKANSDFNLKHADWTREAAQGQYTNLIKMMKDDLAKYHKVIDDRRLKRIGH